MSQLAYGGDGKEDEETMISFAAEDGVMEEAEEDWVATHTSKGEVQASLTFKLLHR